MIGFSEVDLRIVWDTVQFDLPQLKAWLQEILEKGVKDDGSISAGNVGLCEG